MRQFINECGKVAKMHMLCWKYGHTRKVWLRNEIIRKKVGVTSTEHKMRENKLSWYGHVRQRPSNASVRSLEESQSDEIVKGRKRYNVRRLG